MSKFIKINFKKFVIFDFEKDVIFWWNDLFIGCIYNVVVNEEKQYVVVVGVVFCISVCWFGFIFIDFKDLVKFKMFGCVVGDGYVYDVQCLIYWGFDFKYWGWDICYGYNEDILIM